MIKSVLFSFWDLTKCEFYMLSSFFASCWAVKWVGNMAVLQSFGLEEFEILEGTRRVCLKFNPSLEPFHDCLWHTSLQAFDIHYWINKFALMLLCSPDQYRSWVWDFGAPILFVFPLSMWTVGIAEQLFWVADSVG